MSTTTSKLPGSNVLLLLLLLSPLLLLLLLLPALAADALWQVHDSGAFHHHPLLVAATGCVDV
jgi:hypothetical protein